MSSISGVARQRWLQMQLPTAESISRDYFRNAWLVAGKLGLVEPAEDGLAARRTGFAEELQQIVRRLDVLRGLPLATGQPPTTERAPMGQGVRHG